MTASGLSAMPCGQRAQPVQLAGDLGADRGVEAGLRVGDLGGRPGGRAALGDDGVRQVVGQPVAALGGGVRVGQHLAHVGQRRARPGEQGELHRQQHLAGDHQRVAVGQVVQRGRHPALDRVLDRHQRGRDLAVADRLQGLTDRRVRIGLDGRAAGRVSSAWWVKVPTGPK